MLSAQRQFGDAVPPLRNRRVTAIPVPHANAMTKRFVESGEGTADSSADHQPTLGIKCSWCGVIMRQPRGISAHGRLSWSHGICAMCLAQLSEHELDATD